MTRTEFVIRYMKASDEAKKDIDALLKDVKPQKMTAYERLDETLFEIGFHAYTAINKLKKHSTAGN